MNYEIVIVTNLHQVAATIHITTAIGTSSGSGCSGCDTSSSGGCGGCTISGRYRGERRTPVAHVSDKSFSKVQKRTILM